MADEKNIVNFPQDISNEKISQEDLKNLTESLGEVIGDGNSVTSQYPNANVTINSNDRVFALTNGSKISMPNMTGWTRPI